MCAPATDELVALKRKVRDGKVDHPQRMTPEKGHHRMLRRKDAARAVAKVVHLLVLRTELVGLEFSGV